MSDPIGRRGIRSAARGLAVICWLLASLAGASEQGLYSRQGAPTTLEAHTASGEWLVIMLWATTCEICRGEFPKYARFHDTVHEGAGKRVLGIALDGHGNQAEVDRFYASTGATFPTLLADLGPFAGTYQTLTGEQILGTPTFMLYDPQGNLVGLNPGPMRIEALERFIARKRPAAIR